MGISERLLGKWGSVIGAWEGMETSYWCLGKNGDQ